MEVVGVSQFCFPMGDLSITKIPKPVPSNNISTFSNNNSSNSNRKLSITNLIDKDHPPYYFSFILTLGVEQQTLLYGVCLIQHQIARVRIQFYSKF